MGNESEVVAVVAKMEPQNSSVDFHIEILMRISRKTVMTIANVVFDGKPLCYLNDRQISYERQSIGGREDLKASDVMFYFTTDQVKFAEVSDNSLISFDVYLKDENNRDILDRRVTDHKVNKL